MHNLLNYKVSENRRKSVLLVVLFFSILLTAGSLNRFSHKNSGLEDQVAGSSQHSPQNNFYGSKNYPLNGIVISLFMLVFAFLLIEICYLRKINGGLSFILCDRVGKSKKSQFENKDQFKTKNQQTQFFGNRVSALYAINDNGAEAGLLFNVASQKIENESKPEESEIFNKSILDVLNSHIAVINSVGTIIKVNKAWKTQMSDHDSGGLGKYEEGANYFDLFKSRSIGGEGSYIKALTGIQKILAGRLDEFYLEYLAHSRGKETWFCMRVVKLESAETLIVIEHHNIDERKKAEEKMLKAIGQYDIISRATSDTIWDWNIPCNEIVYNEGITKMFGYRVSEVVNAVEWWKMNIHPGDLQRVSETLSDVFQKGIQHIQLEYRFRCADKSYKHIYDRAFIVYDKNGGPTRIIGVMQDVTYEKKDAERIAKTIIDAQERERRYIGQELHDNINQILAGTLLTVAMAKQKQIAAERLSELINLSETYIGQAIDEVRKLSHRLSPALFEDTTLKDIFEEMLVMINQNKEFKIHFHFDDMINVLASEDIQINLYRILQEQVKNILKYSAADKIEVSLKLSKNIVTMRTFDNGKGFDLKTAKKGIGIANIKKRVDLFSGRCIWNSAPGKGCEIIIEIPINSTT